MTSTTSVRAASPAAPLSVPDWQASLRVCLAVAAVLLMTVAVASLAVGSRPVSPATVLDALLGYDSSDNDHLAVVTVRLPRTVVGLVVGAALGLSGALMQGMARNPLADPGLLGISAGASVMVVLAISVLGVSSASGYVWFAFVGATVAVVVVFVIGSVGRDGPTPVKLALAGAATSAALLAVTTGILLADTATFDQYRFWSAGTLSGREMGDVAAVAPFLAVGVVLALSAGRTLNALALGDETARGLGQRVWLARGLAGVAVVLLCGGATAIAGPISFVGLVVPHMARLLTGPDYRKLLPLSMLLAPMLLLAADVLGRVVVRPGEVQVGVVVALLGAPFFIWLVRRRTVGEL